MHMTCDLCARTYTHSHLGAESRWVCDAPPRRWPRGGDTIHYIPALEHGFEASQIHGCMITKITRIGGYAANGDLGPERVSAESVSWLHDECCEGTTIINDTPHTKERGGWHWPDECSQ